MMNLNIHLTLTSPFIAAASGLVMKDQYFLMVADDENHLARYDRKTHRGELLEIFPDQLPTEPKERKKRKPDFESLIDFPDQKQLLLMPSGSTAARTRAAWVTQQGELIGHWDLKDFFHALSAHLEEINIEGGVSLGNHLVLLQRGNGEKGENGLVHCEFTSPDTLIIQSYTPVKLPIIEGVAATFTDACPYGEHLLFLAVAEDSHSTYLDGEVKGSLMGVLTQKGELLWHERLNLASKPEGIWWDEAEGRIYLVTDDDDRKKPSQLFWGEWKGLV